MSQSGDGGEPPRGVSGLVTPEQTCLGCVLGIAALLLAGLFWFWFWWRQAQAERRVTPAPPAIQRPVESRPREDRR